MNVLLRRPVDTPDDDPRRCPVRGVGAFHDFDDPPGGNRSTCRDCHLDVWTMLRRLSDYADRLLAVRR